MPLKQPNKPTFKPFNIFCRGISYLILFFFIVNSTLGYAQGIDIEFFPSNSEFSIPQDLGRIKSIYDAHGEPGARFAPTIIHIEDAHAQLDAQKKIESLLNFLKTKNVETIFLEGAPKGEVSKNLLRFFKDDSLNQKISTKLLEKAYVSGPGNFLLKHHDKKKVRAFGVENQKLYREHLESFRNVYQFQEKINQFLKKTRSALETKNSKLKNLELKKFLKEYFLFQQDQKDLLNHLSVLEEFSKKILQIDLRDSKSQIQYPMLVRFFKLKDLERTVNSIQSAEYRELTKKEKTKLIEWLKSNQLNSRFEKNFQEILSFNSVRTTPLSARAFLEHFYQTAQPKGFTFKDYPNLSKYFAQMILSQELDSELLFNEIHGMTDQLIDELAKNDEEKKLVRDFKEFFLLKKLLSLELTREEWSEISSLRDPKGRSNLEIRQIASVSPRNDKLIAAVFSNATHFYELAEKREQVIFQNLMNTLRDRSQFPMNRDLSLKSQQAVVLVTGGFHSEGLHELFKKNNISFVSVTPKINQIESKDNYLRVILPGLATSTIPQEVMGAMPISVMSSGVQTLYRAELRELLNSHASEKLGPALTEQDIAVPSRRTTRALSELRNHGENSAIVLSQVFQEALRQQHDFVHEFLSFQEVALFRKMALISRAAGEQPELLKRVLKGIQKGTSIQDIVWSESEVFDAEEFPKQQIEEKQRVNGNLHFNTQADFGDVLWLDNNSQTHDPHQDNIFYVPGAFSIFLYEKYEPVDGESPGEMIQGEKSEVETTVFATPEQISKFIRFLDGDLNSLNKTLSEQFRNSEHPMIQNLVRDAHVHKSLEFLIRETDRQVGLMNLNDPLKSLVINFLSLLFYRRDIEKYWNQDGTPKSLIHRSELRKVDEKVLKRLQTNVLKRYSLTEMEPEDEDINDFRNLVHLSIVMDDDGTMRERVFRALSQLFERHPKEAVNGVLDELVTNQLEGIDVSGFLNLQLGDERILPIHFHTKEEYGPILWLDLTEETKDIYANNVLYVPGILSIFITEKYSGEASEIDRPGPEQSVDFATQEQIQLFISKLKEDILAHDQAIRRHINSHPNVEVKKLLRRPPETHAERPLHDIIQDLVKLLTSQNVPHEMGILIMHHGILNMFLQDITASWSEDGTPKEERSRSELRNNELNENAADLAMKRAQAVQDRVSKFYEIHRALLRIFSEAKAAKKENNEAKRKALLNEISTYHQSVDEYAREIQGNDLFENADLNALNGRSPPELKTIALELRNQIELYGSKFISAHNRRDSPELASLNREIILLLKRRLKVQLMRLEHALKTDPIRNQLVIYTLFVSVIKTYSRIAYEYTWRAKRARGQMRISELHMVDALGYEVATLHYEDEPVFRILRGHEGKISIIQIIWKNKPQPFGPDARIAEQTELSFESIEGAIRSRIHALEGTEKDGEQLIYHDIALEDVMTRLQSQIAAGGNLPAGDKDIIVRSVESVLNGPNGKYGLRKKHAKTEDGTQKRAVLPLPGPSLESALTHIRNNQLKDAVDLIRSARRWIQFRLRAVGRNKRATIRKKNYLYLLLRDQSVRQVLNRLQKALDEKTLKAEDLISILNDIEGVTNTHFPSIQSEPNYKFLHGNLRIIASVLKTLIGYLENGRQKKMIDPQATALHSKVTDVLARLGTMDLEYTKHLNPNGFSAARSELRAKVSQHQHSRLFDPDFAFSDPFTLDVGHDQISGTARQLGSHHFLIRLNHSGTSRTANINFQPGENLGKFHEDEVYTLRETTERQHEIVRLTGREITKLGLTLFNPLDPVETRMYQFFRVSEELPKPGSNLYTHLLKDSIRRYSKFGPKDRFEHSFVTRELVRILGASAPNGITFARFFQMLVEIVSMNPELDISDSVKIFGDLLTYRPEIHETLYQALIDIAVKSRRSLPATSEAAIKVLRSADIGEIVLTSPETLWSSGTGGLAGYVSDLSRELKDLGVPVTIITPLFQNEKAHLMKNYKLQDTGRSVTVRFGKYGEEAAAIKIYEAKVERVRVLYLENERYFNQLTGKPAKGESAYQGSNGFRLRFARMLSLGTLLVAREMNIHAKVIHTNDWTTGFVKAYLEGRERIDSSLRDLKNDPHFSETHVLHILHNVHANYQGKIFESTEAARNNQMVHDLGFDPFHDWDFTVRPGEWFSINPTHAAVKFADYVRTVSRGYHERSVDSENNSEFGGLVPLLQQKKDLNQYDGLLNGIALSSRQRRFLRRLLKDEEIRENLSKAITPEAGAPADFKELVQKILDPGFDPSKDIKSFFEMGHEKSRRNLAKLIFDYISPIKKRRLQKAFHLPEDNSKYIYSMLHRIGDQKGHQLLLAEIWDISRPDELKVLPPNQYFESMELQRKLTPEETETVLSYARDSRSSRTTLRAVEIAMILYPDTQWIVAGSVEKGGYYDWGFQDIAARFSDQFRYHPQWIRQDNPLYELIYSGSTVFGMPSLSEPGGLSNAEAAAYGVPRHLTRRDGLKDKEIKMEGFEEAFDFFNPVQWFTSFEHQYSFYKTRPDGWREIQYRAITQDNRWLRSARSYIELYRHLNGVDARADLTALEVAAAIYRARKKKQDDPADELMRFGFTPEEAIGIVMDALINSKNKAFVRALTKSHIPDLAKINDDIKKIILDKLKEASNKRNEVEVGRRIEYARRMLGVDDTSRSELRIDPEITGFDGMTGIAKNLGALSDRAMKEILGDLARANTKYQKGSSRQIQHRTDLGLKEKERVVYFSMEYGLMDFLNIYGGGLGILSGDHVRGTSDFYPENTFVAVGPYWKEGYFKQIMNENGWQTEQYPRVPIERLGAVVKRPNTDEDLVLKVRLPDENGKKDRYIHGKAIRLKVGRADLYLLTTDIAENDGIDPSFKKLFDRLYYGGDRLTRLMQEFVAGFMGVRLMEELGLETKVLHLNEGHMAFAALNLVRREMFKHARLQGLEPDAMSRLIRDHPDEALRRGLTFEQNLEIVRKRILFTSHTPIAAGNEEFETHDVRRFLNHYAMTVGLSVADLVNEHTGVIEKERGRKVFNLTEFAIWLSSQHNGVSKRHGEVSTEMHKRKFDYVTNAVHSGFWQDPKIQDLLNNAFQSMQKEGKFADKTIDDLTFPEMEKLLSSIPDETLLKIKQEIKREAVERIREQTKGEVVLDPDAFTIVIARRFAPYKRADLIFHNDIARKIIEAGKELGVNVQIVFAGKAHPNDDLGKGIIQGIISRKKNDGYKDRVFFVPNYSIQVAKNLIGVASIWLNNPELPKEASGTSGMKAEQNGVLNVSTRDGWVLEAEGSVILFGDPKNDNRDTLAKELLEIMVKPGDGLLDIFKNNLAGWVGFSRKAIADGIVNFNTPRMINQYHGRYRKAVSDSNQIEALQRKIDTQFPGMRSELRAVVDPPMSGILYGEKLSNYIEQALNDRNYEKAAHELSRFVAGTRDTVDATMYSEEYVLGFVQSFNKIAEQFSRIGKTGGTEFNHLLLDFYNPIITYLKAFPDEYFEMDEVRGLDVAITKLAEVLRYALFDREAIEILEFYRQKINSDPDRIIDFSLASAYKNLAIQLWSSGNQKESVTHHIEAVRSFARGFLLFEWTPEFNQLVDFMASPVAVEVIKTAEDESHPQSGLAEMVLYDLAKAIQTFAKNGQFPAKSKNSIVFLISEIGSSWLLRGQETAYELADSLLKLAYQLEPKDIVSLHHFALLQAEMGEIHRAEQLLQEMRALLKGAGPDERIRIDKNIKGFESQLAHARIKKTHGGRNFDATDKLRKKIEEARRIDTEKFDKLKRKKHIDETVSKEDPKSIELYIQLMKRITDLFRKIQNSNLLVTDVLFLNEQQAIQDAIGNAQSEGLSDDRAGELITLLYIENPKAFDLSGPLELIEIERRKIAATTSKREIKVPAEIVDLMSQLSRAMQHLDYEAFEVLFAAFKAYTETKLRRGSLNQAEEALVRSATAFVRPAVSSNDTKKSELRLFGNQSQIISAVANGAAENVFKREDVRDVFLGAFNHLLNLYFEKLRVLFQNLLTNFSNQFETFWKQGDFSEKAVRALVDGLSLELSLRSELRRQFKNLQITLKSSYSGSNVITILKNRLKRAIRSASETSPVHIDIVPATERQAELLNHLGFDPIDQPFNAHLIARRFGVATKSWLGFERKLFQNGDLPENYGSRIISEEDIPGSYMYRLLHNHPHPNRSELRNTALLEPPTTVVSKPRLIHTGGMKFEGLSARLIRQIVSDLESDVLNWDANSFGPGTAEIKKSSLSPFYREGGARMIVSPTNVLKSNFQAELRRINFKRKYILNPDLKRFSPPEGSLGQFILYATFIADRPAIVILQLQPSDEIRGISQKKRRELNAWKQKAVDAVGEWGEKNGVLIFAAGSEVVTQFWPEMNFSEHIPNYEKPYDLFKWQKEPWLFAVGIQRKAARLNWYAWKGNQYSAVLSASEDKTYWINQLFNLNSNALEDRDAFASAYNALAISLTADDLEIMQIKYDDYLRKKHSAENQIKAMSHYVPALIDSIRRSELRAQTALLETSKPQAKVTSNESADELTTRIADILGRKILAVLKLEKVKRIDREDLKILQDSFLALRGRSLPFSEAANSIRTKMENKVNEAVARKRAQLAQENSVFKWTRALLRLKGTITNSDIVSALLSALNLVPVSLPEAGNWTNEVRALIRSDYEGPVENGHAAETSDKSTQPVHTHWFLNALKQSEKKLIAIDLPKELESADESVKTEFVQFLYALNKELSFEFKISTFDKSFQHLYGKLVQKNDPKRITFIIRSETDSNSMRYVLDTDLVMTDQPKTYEIGQWTQIFHTGVYHNGLRTSPIHYGEYVRFEYAVILALRLLLHESARFTIVGKTYYVHDENMMMNVAELIPVLMHEVKSELRRRASA